MSGGSGDRICTELEKNNTFPGRGEAEKRSWIDNQEVCVQRGGKVTSESLWLQGVNVERPEVPQEESYVWISAGSWE